MIEQPVRRRFPALYVALALMFVLLAGQLYRLQIVDGSKYVKLSEDNREREVRLKASRGIIYDRNGHRLVVNNPSYAVSITPADLPDINCAVGDLAGSAVFNDLARILHTSFVVALTPYDLPVEKKGEVANRLSVILQTPADNIRGPLNSIMETSHGSKNLFVVRKDLSPEVAKAVQAELENLPGISVYNQLEFNFIQGFTRFQGFDKCLKPIVVMNGVDYDTMQLVDTDSAPLPGVSVAPEPVRQYPDGPFFSHLMGYVGPISEDVYASNSAQYEPDDKIGQTGLEEVLEDQLRGRQGTASMVVNSHERIVSEMTSQAPITGNNVTLTIDADLQKAVTTSLQKGLQAAKVRAGVAIVVRVDNGQVLAMVSLPSYDNNLFADGISQKDFDSLNTDPTKPMFNRAISGVYPPGSTYKMISAAAALQEGVVTPSTTYFCPGSISVPYTFNENKRTTFRDWRAAGHGTINVVQALTVSSDVFFYITAGPRQEDRRVAKADGTEQLLWTRYYPEGAAKPSEFNGLGIDRLHQYATAFGLGKKTGIDLPGEATGVAPTRDWKVKQFHDNPWSLGDTLVSAIGQGFDLVTPLQLVNVTASVANGGTLYKPQLVQKITGPDGKVVQDYQPQALGQVPVSPENLAVVREGMRQVVADPVKGTAAGHVTLKSIPWAGKTGTAEYGDPIGKKNGKDVRRSHAWFTAFAPYDKPEVAVVVLLEGGEESLEGSTYAVPVTDEILKAYFHVEK